MTEKDIQNSILDFLRWKGVFCWPNQSIGVYDKDRKCYRRPNNKHHLNGVSDILGIYKGKPLAIEVKKLKPKTYPTEEQKEFIARVILEGGIAFIARSIEDVEKGLA
jgi:penicillin-binding protein-related factor A (putative recombinase)